MKYVEFKDMDKIQCFDEISQHFYNGNFGQMSKSDFELLMFHFYLQKMVQQNVNEDGTIDYRKCSDYKISTDLGITQQKVRNLKIRSHLVFPIQYDWKKALATLTEHARYDEISKRITLAIPDPNLFFDIQNYLEEHGAFIEKQLNNKVLQLRVEYYIQLIVELEPEKTKKEIIKEIRQIVKRSAKEEQLFVGKDLARVLIDTGSDIASIIEIINDLISPDNLIGKALIGLIQSI